MNKFDEELEQAKNLMLVSLISADNKRYSEEVKQEIIKRMEEKPKQWEYIFEPLGENAEKWVTLMNTNEIN